MSSSVSSPSIGEPVSAAAKRLREGLVNRDVREVEYTMQLEEGKKAALVDLDDNERRVLWDVALNPASRGLLRDVVETLPHETLIQPIDPSNIDSIPIRLVLEREMTQQSLLQHMIHLCPKPLDYKFSNGGFLLHEAAKCSVHVDVMQFIMIHHPSATRSADNKGNLPLHVLLEHTTDAMSQNAKHIVKAFLEAYPEATQQPNLEGYLPLHMAAMNRRVTRDMTRLVYDANPDAIKTIARVGLETPLSVACGSCMIVSASALRSARANLGSNVPPPMDSSSTLSAAGVIRSVRPGPLRVHMSKLLFLLQEYPCASLQKNTSDITPFQKLDHSQCRAMGAFLFRSSNIGRQIAEMVDSKQNNIAHLLAQTKRLRFGTAEDQQKQPQHLPQRHTMLELFVSEVPNLTRGLNDRGEIPLHIYLKQGYNDADTVALEEQLQTFHCLLKAYPQGSIARDASTNFYPFMLAATKDIISLDVVYHLVQGFASYQSLCNMQN